MITATAGSATTALAPSARRLSATAGFAPLYRRRVFIALKKPVAFVSQVLTPVLWVLVVGPALAHAFGGFARNVDYFSYVSIGQIVFVIPFSAMFAGLTVLFDKDWGILRDLLVAPIRRSTILLANTAAVLTVAAGQFALIIGLALARGASFQTTPLRLLFAIAAAALLGAGVYGIAEFLAYTITQAQAFGTLIPAIGATPYALCGALFPVAVLPVVIKQIAWVLPWTQCVDLLRFGLMGNAASASGFREIWPTQNIWTDALLSLATLVIFAVLMQLAAQRAFKKAIGK
jgi:ABC-2 type transport system permease protein